MMPESLFLPLCLFVFVSVPVSVFASVLQTLKFVSNNLHFLDIQYIPIHYILHWYLIKCISSYDTPNMQTVLGEQLFILLVQVYFVQQQNTAQFLDLGSR